MREIGLTYTDTLGTLTGRCHKAPALRALRASASQSSQNANCGRVQTNTMAKSLIILALAVAFASAFTFKEAVPHQEKAAATHPSFSNNFDSGLDNPDVVSDVSRPSRGFQV